MRCCRRSGAAVGNVPYSPTKMRGTNGAIQPAHAGKKIVLDFTSTIESNASPYHAEVWDSPDRGMIATVETKHCLGCKSLVEVPIEFEEILSDGWGLPLNNVKNGHWLNI